MLTQRQSVLWVSELNSDETRGGLVASSQARVTPRILEDFTGYKTLSQSGNHEQSHQASWKEPFYPIKCD